ncbi:MAG: carboxymuconolactone decarboxylase family protein [Proteobacteria bacterium]|nr:carboxymuconolactone decarboxylase family protein [Pseudomonadota bacterium]
MKPIDPAHASAEAKAVFDDIKAVRKTDDINNFWKYLANEPRMMKHTWESLKAIMGKGALDPLVKELVYVAVSITNNCEYCMASHGAAARAKGATEEQMNELFAVVALANMTNRLANAYKVPVDDAFKDPA